MSRTVLTFGLVMLGLSLLVGCQPAQPAAAPATEVRLGEFYFKPEVIRLKAGQQVQLELLNEGQIEHEFMVGRGPEIHMGKPEGFEHNFFEGIQVTHTAEKGMFMKSEHGWMLKLEAGGKATLTFTVPADWRGEWEMACMYPGHYEARMRGQLIVE